MSETTHTYPHQIHDEVTPEMLHDDITENPDAYHQGLVPHIERHLEEKLGRPVDQEILLEVINLERRMLGQAALSGAASDPKSAEYVDYRESLVALHTSQDALIQSFAMSDEDKDKERVEKELFKSRQYSPRAWETITKLSGEGFFSSISESQREQAAQSIDKWLAVADDVINANEETFVKQIPLFQTVWGREKTEQYLESVARRNPSILLSRFDSISEHMDQSTVATLAKGAASAYLELPGYYGGLREALRSERLRSVLGQEVSVGLARRELLDGSTYHKSEYVDGKMVPMQPLSQYLVEVGLVSEQDVANGLLNICNNDTYVSNYVLNGVDANREVVDRTGLLEQIKDAMLQALRDKRLTLNGVVDADFLSDDEKRHFIIEGLRADPSPLSDIFQSREFDAYIDAATKRSIIDESLEGMSPEDIASLVWGLGEECMSRDEKRALIRESFSHNPEAALGSTSIVESIFSEDEISDMMSTAAESLTTLKYSYTMNVVDKWLPLVTKDPNEQRAIVDRLRDSLHPMDMIYSYEMSDLLKSMYSIDEMEKWMHDSLVEYDASQYHSGNTDTLIKVFGEEHIKDLSKEMVDINTDSAVLLLKKTYHLFESSELASMVKQIAETDMDQLLRYDFLLARLSTNEIAAIVERDMQSDSIDAAGTIIRIGQVGNLDRSLYDGLNAKLMDINPAASYIMQYAPSMRTKAFEAVRNHDAIQQAAPKWFKMFMETFEKSNDSSRQIVMAEAAQTFDNFMHISYGGQGAIDLVQKLGTNGKLQEEVIGKIGFVLRNREQSGVVEQIQSIQDLDLFVHQTMEQSLNIQISESARDANQTAMIPLIAYVQRFSRSPRHNQLLGELITSRSSVEAYQDFRLIADDEQSLAEAKSAGLLPQGLSGEQHRLWRQETLLTSTDSLSATADDVRVAINVVLRQNAQAFTIEDNVSEHTDVAKIQDEISELGQEIGRLHRQRTLPGVDIEGLEEVIAETERQQAGRQMQLWVHNLSHLTPENIIDGRVKSSKEGKKAQEITALLDRLGKVAAKQNLPQEARLAVVRIEQMLDSFRNTTDGERNLSVSDTIDLKTTMEIGAKPVGSCQHYATGAYRECLVGYTEPNTKAIVLRDGNAIVARSILRLLGDTDGNPVLHAETIYTQNPSAAVTQKIYGLLVEKADQMGVPAMVSRSSQGADGNSIDSLRVDGFHLETTQTEAGVGGLRAPLVYVDSLSGRTAEPYRISNMMRVQASV